MIDTAPAASACIAVSEPCRSGWSNHHRRLAARPMIFQERNAIHARHFHVEGNPVRPLLFSSRSSANSGSGATPITLDAGRTPSTSLITGRTTAESSTTDTNRISHAPAVLLINRPSSLSRTRMCDSHQLDRKGHQLHRGTFSFWANACWKVRMRSR